MILRKNTILLTAGVVLLICEVGTARRKAKRGRTRKPTIDELPLPQILLRSIIKHDGCRLYYPWSDYTNPSFELNNATCWHGCKIVADLYDQHYPTKPRLIRSGGCSKSLKLIFLECRCQLTRDYATLLRWRSLKHCAHKYLAGIVDFTINDTRPTTTTTTTTVEYDEDLIVPTQKYKNYETTPVITSTAIVLAPISETTVTTSLTVVAADASTVVASDASTVTAAVADQTELSTAVVTSTVSTTTVTTTTTTTTTTTPPPTTRRKKVKKKPNKPWRRNG